MCISMHMCVYTYVCAGTYTYIYTHMYMYMYIHLYICICVYVYIYVYTYIHICVYIHVQSVLLLHTIQGNKNIHTPVYMCIYIYVYYTQYYTVFHGFRSQLEDRRRQAKWRLKPIGNPGRSQYPQATVTPCFLMCIQVYTYIHITNRYSLQGVCIHIYIDMYVYENMCIYIYRDTVNLFEICVHIHIRSNAFWYSDPSGL